MATERWGTFSVIDHKNPAALIPEVLMYDRLVLPYPENVDDRAHWAANGWAPELLDYRLDQLGDLGVKARWNSDIERNFQAWMENLSRIQFDVDNINEEAKQEVPYAVTRCVLAQETLGLPKGVTRVTKVAAYQSEIDLKTHFILEDHPLDQRRGMLGYMLAHRLAIPADQDPEISLAKAISLSRDNNKFRENRQRLYEWQERILNENIPPDVAVAEMDQMVAAYNQSVEEAVSRVFYKFAFTLTGIGLGLTAAGMFNPIASMSALLAIVQFATFDRKPVVQPDINAPAAMFHDVEANFCKFSWA